MNFVCNMYRQPLAHRNMDKFAIRYKKGVQHKSQSDTRVAQKFKKKNWLGTLKSYLKNRLRRSIHKEKNKK